MVNFSVDCFAKYEFATNNVHTNVEYLNASACVQILIAEEKMRDDH